MTTILFYICTGIAFFGARVAKSCIDVGNRPEIPELRGFGRWGLRSLAALISGFALVAIEIPILDPTLENGFFGLVFGGQTFPFAIPLVIGLFISFLCSFRAVVQMASFLDDEKPENLLVFGQLGKRSIIVASLFSLFLAGAVCIIMVLPSSSSLVLIPAMAFTAFGPIITIFMIRSAFFFRKAFQSLKELQGR